MVRIFKFPADDRSLLAGLPLLAAHGTMAASAAPTDAGAGRSGIIRLSLDALVNLPAAAANERADSAGLQRNTAVFKVC